MSSMSGSTGKAPPQIKEKIPSGLRQFNKQSPEQQALMAQELQGVGPDSYLYKLANGDQSTFNEMEAPAHRQFNEKTGEFASRFSAGGGQGSLSARRSSGFQNFMGAQASNFAQDLQAKRGDLRNQAIRDLHNMSTDLLNIDPYERYMKPEKEGTNWGGLIGGGVGAVGGFFAGGPMGAVSGAQAGYSAGSSLSGRGGGGGGGGWQGSPGWKPSWNGQGSGGGQATVAQAQGIYA